MEKVDVDKVMQRRDARPGRQPRSRQRVSDPPNRSSRSKRQSRCRRATSASISRGSTTCASSRRATDSPAAKAGLRTGDYVRAIDDKPTREMSVCEGMRALRGAPGTKVTLTIIRGSAADPHVVELTRETLPALGRHEPDGGARRRLRAHRGDRRRHGRPGQDAGRRSHRRRARRA